MVRKGMLATIILVIMVLFAGCDSDSKQVNESSVNIITDNDVSANLLVSNMIPLTGTQKDDSRIKVLKAKVNDDSFDFSSVAYSESEVALGDAIYVEGVIPQSDYPSDKVFIYAEPEEKVSFENAVLSNKDGDTILTVDVVGEETGKATIYTWIDDSEYIHSFDLEITESPVRSMPNSYSVYCTPTGKKYHSYGCRYLRGNGIEISLNEALSKGLGPCSICHP